MAPPVGAAGVTMMTVMVVMVVRMELVAVVPVVLEEGAVAKLPATAAASAASQVHAAAAAVHIPALQLVSVVTWRRCGFVWTRASQSHTAKANKQVGCDSADHKKWGGAYAALKLNIM